MKPLVNILTCAYNHEKYIAQTIEGVLIQKTSFNFVHIIGDDASTDNTANIIEQYRQKYPEKIKFIKHDINIGAQENTIILFKNLNAKYIAPCDGDDYWTDPYKLQKQVDFLEANPEYGMVHTNGDLLFDRNGEYKKNVQKAYIENSQSNQFYDLLQWQYYTILTCSVLMLNALLIKYVNFDEIKKFTMGDTPIFLEFAKNSRIGFIDESMVVHRILKESVSKTQDPIKRSKFGLSNNKMRLFYAHKHNCPPKILNNIKLSYYKSLLYHHFLVVKDNPEIDTAFSFLLSSGITTLEKYKYKIFYFSIKFSVIGRFLSILQLAKLRLKSILIPK